MALDAHTSFPHQCLERGEVNPKLQGIPVTKLAQQRERQLWTPGREGGETQDKDGGPGEAHVQQQWPDIPQSCLWVSEPKPCPCTWKTSPVFFTSGSPP